MRRVVAVTLVVLLVALVAGFVFLDTLLKAGLLRIVARTTGTEATAEALDVGLPRSLELRGLVIGNPPGFNTPYFFRLERLDLTLAPQTVLRSTVRVPQLTLSGMTLQLEYEQGRTNVMPILQHVRETATAPEPGEQPTGRTYIIDELRLTGMTALVYPSEAIEPLRITLPDTVLRQVGGERGVVTQELIATVLGAVLERVAQYGGLPGDLGALLQGGLSEFGGRFEEELKRLQEGDTGQIERTIEEQRRELEERAGERLRQFLEPQQPK